VTTYLLTLEGDSVVCQIENPADIEKLRAHGVAVAACDDEQAMAPLLATMHPQARGLMESGLVRSLERLGQAMERVVLLNATEKTHTATDRHFRDPWGPDAIAPPDFFRNEWDIHIDPAKIYRSPDPNAGKQAPPPSREWWASHPAGARGNVPPRHRTGPIAGRETVLPDKKAKRKAEKLARRKQR
jgi:hypothetical protein